MVKKQEVLDAVPAPGVHSPAEERVKRGLYLKDKVMEEGTHYVTIKDKPCMTKIGGELLRAEFKLGVRSTYEKQEMADGELLFTVTSEVYELSTGLVWGTGLGCGCTDEKEFGSLGIAANTTIKMAEKRAVIDATINSIGMSEIFTQDLEDWEGGDLANAKIVKGGGKRMTSPAPIKNLINAGPAAPKPAANAKTPAQAKGGGKTAYSEFWASLAMEDRNTLNEAETYYRGQMDAATTPAELEAVGAEIGEQELPSEFVTFMRELYSVRLAAIQQEG